MIVMRMRRAITCIIGVAVAGTVLVLMRSAPAVLSPPMVKVVRLEPAGIFDDAGVEMWLATLTLSNSDSRPSSWENGLYVKNGGTGIEAKVANQWIKVKGMLDCALTPGERAERLILMPAGVDGCRVSLKQVGSRVVGGRVARVAWHLPQFIRFRLPTRFWLWVGYVQYGPGSDWQEISLELPLPPKSPRDVSIAPGDG